MAVESKIKNPPQTKPFTHDSEYIIEFNNVRFCYPSRPTTAALDDVKLSIKQGETIAIVGPSGAGKTTLFELLQRFYDPEQGSIKLYGVPIFDLSLQALREQVGSVQQQAVLFSSDVWHNVRYGHADASDDDVIAASKRAHAHDFIESLPEGYNSFLGEQGLRLSGGQKQRLAIARALLKDANILLLDEATSALDSESEAHVQAALADLMSNKTTLIIAHRLATVRHADKIIVMDKGKIVAQGTHDDLFVNNPLYKRLCQLQFDQGKRKIS